MNLKPLPLRYLLRAVVKGRRRARVRVHDLLVLQHDLRIPRWLSIKPVNDNGRLPDRARR